MHDSAVTALQVISTEAAGPFELSEEVEGQALVERAFNGAVPLPAAILFGCKAMMLLRIPAQLPGNDLRARVILRLE